MLEGGYTLPRVTPEVGAVCGSSARTDLCGGRSAMTVPTATVIRYRNRKRQVCEKSRLGLYRLRKNSGSGRKDVPQGLNRLRKNPVSEASGFRESFRKSSAVATLKE